MDSLKIKSSSISLHSLTPQNKKVSPLRSPKHEESRDNSLTKYSELIPMKGLTSSRSKLLNPLQVYYKNLDVLKTVQRDRPVQRVMLPSLSKMEIEGGSGQDEIALAMSINFDGLNSKGKDWGSLQKLGSMKNLKESHEPPAPANEYFLLNRDKANPSKNFKSTQSFRSLSKQPENKNRLYGEDYVDAKKKQEFQNLDKRTKKMMEIRMQTNNNMKTRYLSQYLGSGAKAQASEISTSFTPSFASFRNEYPILS